MNGGVAFSAFHGGESSQLDQVFALFFHRLLCHPGADNNNSNASDADNPASASPWWQLAMDGMCAAPLLQLSEENRVRSPVGFRPLLCFSF